MSMIELSPTNYPLEKKESWWIVHPNDGDIEFCVPNGAYTLCLKSLKDFKSGSTYPIINNDSGSGWISVFTGKNIYKMPYYIFARYFDKDSFIKIQKGREFHRNPEKPVQLELFED